MATSLFLLSGQWEKIESTLRNYIIKAKLQATVVTLTLGITELEDENGNERDIFLFYNQANEDKLIKVPKLYAKVIYTLMLRFTGEKVLTIFRNTKECVKKSCNP